MNIINILLIVIMNLTVYPLILIWTGFGILVFPFVFTLYKLFTSLKPDQIMRKLVWLYGRGWMMVVSPFVRFQTEDVNLEHVKPPCVFVVNHLSFFDTYCMAMLPQFDISFAVRAWPFRMFWYAPFMQLARYIDVESAGWEYVAEAGKQILDEGSAVLFFPEGHRSKDGELQRFFSGAFQLAIESGAVIIPLCLTGSGDLLPPGRWWLKPARIKMRALPAVDPAEFQGESAHTRMRLHVKDMMKKNLRRMKFNG
jgi:1-acyl-sn-glycerol-3-phosphate acyltransferase